VSPQRESARAELAALAAGLAAHAERLSWLGVARTARPAAPGAARGLVPAPAGEAGGGSPRDTARDRAGAPAATAAGAADDPVSRNVALAAGCADLEGLRAVVAACTACPLAETRTQTVFADGSERARVLFIGEAPGQNEDRQGVPFVGRAGGLLTDIVTKGMGLARAEVYIANVLKCRPPENRDPEASEKACCTPFLDRQIELVDPEVIITLGLHATRHVLGSKESMGRLRGRVHLRGARRVVATYHPAYLLRSPHMKKACWEDIQLAMGELGLSPAEQPGGARRDGNRPSSGR